MNIKKEIELDFLNEFKKTTEYNFDILEIDRESPDFIIKHKNRNIGVEITGYFIDDNIGEKGGSHLKLKESEQEKVINSSLNAYQTKKLPPLIVKVKFVSGLIFSKSNKEKISNTLVEALSKVDIENEENKNIVDRTSSNDLSEYFSLVYVLKSPVDKNSWQNINFGFVTDLSEENIRGIIKGKEVKLNRYQESVNINWLVIYSDRRYPSSMIETPKRKLNYKFDTKFDKVFILTYPETKCYEINNTESN